MNPDPSAPPPGKPSLPPPGSRPSGIPSRDIRELDLWSLDDDPEADLSQNAPPAQASPAGGKPSIPAPGAPQVASEPLVQRFEPPAEPALAETPTIRIDVGRSLTRIPYESGSRGAARPEAEFDDLEHWDNDEIEALAAEPLAPADGETPSTAAPLPSPAEAPAAAPAAEAATKPASRVVTPRPDDDEFSPVIHHNTQPLPLKPSLGLSKTERMSLTALLALLLLGGAGVMYHSLTRLPTASERLQTEDFPIRGSFLTVESATTYWRAPALDGPMPEPVRRGTVLIPVLELRTSGGKGVIRIIFRDGERTAIGDAVTLKPGDAGKSAVAATAGFDDMGMHAAYRTGGEKAWTAEVFEAASENSPAAGFKRLFEMNISTDRR
jgi:hypothetical protein